MNWFTVRHVLSLGEELFEERITLWWARDFDEAISLAENEASAHARITDHEDGVLPLFQAFLLSGRPTRGAEIYSLIRHSSLGPEEYLDRHFDSGDELTQS